MTKFLTGKDYPWLCPRCQAVVDASIRIVALGEDTDDEEAPCNFVYDHALFCGGRECVNKLEDYK